MNDPIDPAYSGGPQPPVARPAVAMAGLLVVLLVFVVGMAVGSSGILGPRSTPRPSPVAVQPTPAPGSTPAPLPSNVPGNFALFWQALQTVRDSFVGRGELTDEQLTNGAIRGMIEALGDTGHSVFLTPEAVAAENESLGGTVVGIGVLLGERNAQVVVVSVISGGPADDAGIRSGDRILTIDGASVEGLAPEEVAPRVRGEAGSTVVLNIERPATGEDLEFSIVREELRFPAAYWTMVPGTNIGFLRLVQFSTGSADELRAARDEAIDAGAESLILDLRSNPGGYVDEAVDIASLFLSDRVVFLSEDAAGTRTEVRTNSSVEATDLPLVLLIDEGSASSSEIVTGAIRSAGRAELIGTTTFGTGTVLQTFPLTNGSAIRLATERWLTPDGELIFGQGIDPTTAVELPADQTPLDPIDVRDMPADEIDSLPDDQLRRAIELLTQ
ncbi:MAG TPA: S41 family peptidase [Candidatus Limnocylindrales bacterium]|nr:S41 family peptidase [Candidatus Limnocylindrales bacterium]